MINQCFQCYLWRESVFLLCQELCGLALVVASQDRSVVETGPGQREQATEEGLKAAIPPGYWLDILSADGGAAQVSVESCKETSLSLSPQHKPQRPPPGSSFGNDLHLGHKRLSWALLPFSPKSPRGAQADHH